MAKVNLDKANIKDDNVYMYFLYSETQQKERTTIEARINRIFVPGTVIVRGKPQKYTELSRKPTNTYSDTVIVTSGYLASMNYTKITSKNKL